jgi:membrane-associated protease RseP (regulator of RpoE activity)
LRARDAGLTPLDRKTGSFPVEEVFMRKLSACLAAATLSLVSASASAHPHPSSPPPDPWQRFEQLDHSTSKARLGVMVMSMTPELRQYFGAPNERGVLVVKIEPGSPAAAAGIKVGDVLVTVRGEKVDDAGDVISALAGSKQGDKVSVGIVRDKKQMSIDATMGTGPSASLQSLLREAIPWFDFSALARRSSST